MLSFILADDLFSFLEAMFELRDESEMIDDLCLLRKGGEI